MIDDPWRFDIEEPGMRLIVTLKQRLLALRIAFLVAVGVMVGAIRYATWPIGHEFIVATVKWLAIGGVALVAGIAIRRAWLWWRGPT